MPDNTLKLLRTANIAVFGLGALLLVGVVFFYVSRVWLWAGSEAVPSFEFIFWLVMYSLYEIGIGIAPYAVAAWVAYANRCSHLVQGMVLANIVGLLVLAVTLYIDAFVYQRDEYSSMVFEELPVLQLVFLAPLFIMLVARRWVNR